MDFIISYKKTAASSELGFDNATRFVLLFFFFKLIKKCEYGHTKELALCQN